MNIIEAEPCSPCRWRVNTLNIHGERCNQLCEKDTQTSLKIAVICVYNLSVKAFILNEYEFYVLDYIVLYPYDELLKHFVYNNSYSKQGKIKVNTSNKLL